MINKNSVLADPVYADNKVMLNMSSFDMFSVNVFCKDLDSEYIYINPAAMVAAKGARVGINDNDAPWSLLAKQYLLSDELALKQGYYETIEPFIARDGVKSALVRKTCLRDDRGNAIGILGMSQFVNDSIITQTTHNACEIPITGKQAKALFQGISSRESEILYLMIRGLSLTEISLQLNLSRCTVVGYFNNLKDRYMVQSKPELIQKAIQMGFIFFIPENLI